MNSSILNGQIILLLVTFSIFSTRIWKIVSEKKNICKNIDANLNDGSTISQMLAYHKFAIMFLND